MNINYWIWIVLPSTTNGLPNQIQCGLCKGYFSPTRAEIIYSTSNEVIK